MQQDLEPTRERERGHGQRGAKHRRAENGNLSRTLKHGCNKTQTTKTAAHLDQIQCPPLGCGRPGSVHAGARGQSTPTGRLRSWSAPPRRQPRAPAHFPRAAGGASPAEELLSFLRGKAQLHVSSEMFNFCGKTHPAILTLCWGNGEDLSVVRLAGWREG